MELSVLSVAVFPLSSTSHSSENPWFSTLGFTRKIEWNKTSVILDPELDKVSPEGDSIKQTSSQ